MDQQALHHIGGHLRARLNGNPISRLRTQKCPARTETCGIATMCRFVPLRGGETAGPLPPTAFSVAKSRGGRLLPP